MSYIRDRRELGRPGGKNHRFIHSLSHGILPNGSCFFVIVSAASLQQAVLHS